MLQPQGRHARGKSLLHCRIKFPDSPQFLRRVTFDQLPSRPRKKASTATLPQPPHQQHNSSSDSASASTSEFSFVLPTPLPPSQPKRPQRTKISIPRVSPQLDAPGPVFYSAARCQPQKVKKISSKVGIKTLNALFIKRLLTPQAQHPPGQLLA